MQGREFDIITGEPRRKYKSETRREPHYTSYDVLGMGKNSNLEQMKSNLPRLGRPKDFRKEFTDSQPAFQNFESFPQAATQTNNLLNAVSTKYNIINHTKTAGQIYNKQLPENSRITYKKEAISKIYDLGRLYAPNFNQQYQDKLKSDSQAYHRQKGSCAEILEIGKSYGPRAKLFRRFK